MSDQNDKCQTCDGRGIVGMMTREGGEGWTCEDCLGTGLESARAGVSCAALVGASDAESAKCPKCGADLEDNSDGSLEASWEDVCCPLCDWSGTDGVERIAPTTPVTAVEWLRAYGDPHLRM